MATTDENLRELSKSVKRLTEKIERGKRIKDDYGIGSNLSLSLVKGLTSDGGLFKVFGTAAKNFFREDYAKFQKTLMGKVYNHMAESFKKLLNTRLANAIKDTFSNITGFITSKLDYVLGDLKIVVDTMVKAVKTIGVFAKNVGGFIMNITGLSKIGKTVQEKLLEKIYKSLEKSRKEEKAYRNWLKKKEAREIIKGGLLSKIGKNLLGIGIFIIGIIFGAIRKYIKNWKDLKKKLSDWRDWISKKFRKIIDWTKNKLKDIGQRIGKAFDDIKAKVIKKFEDIKTRIGKSLDDFKAKFLKKIEDIKTRIRESKLGKAFENLSNRIRNLFGRINEILYGKEVEPGTGKKGGGGIIGKINDVIRTIKNSKIVKTIGKGLDWLRDSLLGPNGLFGRMQNFLFGSVEPGTGVRSGGIISKLGDLAKAIGDSKVIQSFKNGLTKMKNGLFGESGVFTKIGEFFGSKDGKGLLTRIDDFMLSGPKWIAKVWEVAKWLGKFFDVLEIIWRGFQGWQYGKEQADKELDEYSTEFEQIAMEVQGIASGMIKGILDVFLWLPVHIVGWVSNKIQRALGIQKAAVEPGTGNVSWTGGFDLAKWYDENITIENIFKTFTGIGNMISNVLIGIADWVDRNITATLVYFLEGEFKADLNLFWEKTTNKVSNWLNEKVEWMMNNVVDPIASLFENIGNWLKENLTWANIKQKVIDFIPGGNLAAKLLEEKFGNKKSASVDVSGAASMVTEATKKAIEKTKRITPGTQEFNEQFKEPSFWDNVKNFWGGGRTEKNIEESKEAQEELLKEATNKGSLYTNDFHTQELMKIQQKDNKKFWKDAFMMNGFVGKLLYPVSEKDKKIASAAAGLSGPGGYQSGYQAGPGGAQSGGGGTRNIPSEYREMVESASSKYNVPADLLAAQIETESGWNPNAKSPAGAMGLAQFMPGTWKQYGKGGDPYDPAASIDAQARYMRDLLDMYGGDVNKALAAYNWGAGNLQKKGMGAMPTETRNYLKYINQRRSKYQGGGGNFAQGAEWKGGDSGESWYAESGVKIQGMKPSVMSRFIGMADEYYAKTGHRVPINSAFRTYEDQVRMRKKHGSLAARPGTSPHQYGIALDVDTWILDKMDSMGLMQKYGFSRPYERRNVKGERIESWHIQPIGSKGRVSTWDEWSTPDAGTDSDKEAYSSSETPEQKAMKKAAGLKGFKNGGVIPSNGVGIVGEVGPEVVSGPGRVTTVDDIYASSRAINGAGVRALAQHTREMKEENKKQSQQMVAKNTSINRAVSENSTPIGSVTGALKDIMMNSLIA